MSEKLLDAAVESSTTEDAQVDSSTTEELVEDGISTPDSTPEATSPDEPSVRDDAPLRNQLGEAQRLLKESQTQNQQLLNAVQDLTNRPAPEPQKPQFPTAKLPEEIYAKYEAVGTSREQADLQYDVMNALIQSGQQNAVPQNQGSVITMNRLETDQLMGSKRYTQVVPWRSEVDALLAKTNLEVRGKAGVVEQAIRMVEGDHMDDITANIERNARTEAAKNRRVEGDALTSPSSTITIGDKTVELIPGQAALAKKLGIDPKKVAEASLAREERERKKLGKLAAAMEV